MNPIRDTDLILYHYRDGLDADAIAAIAAALADSAELRARYAQLCATLAAVDELPLPAPSAQFEQRLWEELWPRLQASADTPASREEPVHGRGGVTVSRRERHAGERAVPRRVLWAGVLGVVVALATGYLIGRQQAPSAPTVALAPTPTSALPAEAAANLSARVLDAYVAAHLRETESVVLTAAHSDDSTLLLGNRELAGNLIASNRLYAQAATRAGNPRLAEFLRQLEPLLIELANPPGAGPIQDVDGLRDYLDKTDLLFQLRATRARMTPHRTTSA